jgi:hypothetical protein
MKAEEYRELKMEIEGWPVHMTSYRIGETFHCTLDNVSPGATLARTTGKTREEAEKKAIERATERLGRTKRHPV